MALIGQEEKTRAEPSTSRWARRGTGITVYTTSGAR